MRVRNQMILCILLSLAQLGQAQLWEELGQGMSGNVNGYVTNFYAASNGLYIGGTFTHTSEEVVVSKIMFWNGTELIPIGCGLDWDCSSESAISPSSGVTEIVVYHDTLIASGGFSFSGSTPIAGIGYWNGEEWMPFSEGFYPGVAGMVVYEDTLYAYGGFSNYGEIDLNGIAKWNGSTWIEVYNFPHWSGWMSSPNAVKCMEWYNGELYVGGNWTASDLDNMNDLVRWNGVEWTSVGVGLHGGLAFVKDMTVFKDKLYVAGWFNQMESSLNPGNFIASWDGTTWDDLFGGTVNPFNQGANGMVNDIYATDEFLYVVGQFHYAGGINTDFIAKWDGEQWCGYAASEEGYFLWNPLYSACVYDGDLYIGGQFHTVGGAEDMDIVLKYVGPDECLIVSNSDISQSSNDLTAFPNPASNYITIHSFQPIGQFSEISIFDSSGRKVEIEYVINDNLSISINVSALSSGLYILTMSSDDTYSSISFAKE